jgi:hypothetical protein
VPSVVDNFQARYVIRHAWTGPIGCQNPVRGRWGAKPVLPGVNPGVNAAGPNTGGTIAAVGLAHADRTKEPLSKLVVAGLEDPKSWDEAVPLTPPPAQNAPAKKSKGHRRRRACHCELRALGADRSSAWPLGVALLVPLTWRRAARRR